ncbi:4'-phosphopantetheinyl transferase family protein [Synechococcus sp.]
MAGSMGSLELKQSRLGWGALKDPADGDLLAGITAQEQCWAETLPSPIKQRFLCSRFLVRRWLAHWFDIDPLEIPLKAPPGVPPLLAQGWGEVSWSHSAERLLLGWSRKQIGVDLERASRPLAAKALMQRFFPEIEQAQLVHLKGDALHQAVLSSWVAKEALIKQKRSSIALELSDWCKEYNQPIARHLPSGISWPVQVSRISFDAELWLVGWSGAMVPPLETFVSS